MKTAFISPLSLGLLAAMAATAAATGLIDSTGPGYRQLSEPASARLQEDLTPVSMRMRNPARPQVIFGPMPWNVPELGAPAATGEAPFSSEIRLFDLSGTKPALGGRYSFPKALPFEWLEKPVLSR